MPIEARGYDHVNLACRDIERSMRFYSEVLNLPVCRCDRNAQGAITFVSVQAGPAILDLMPAPAGATPDTSKLGMNHLALEVAPCDADALVHELRAQGVEVYEGPVRRQGAKGMGIAVYLRDPDGHGVELKQYP